MDIYIYIAVISFIFGFIVSALIFKKHRNENAIFTLLNDFKKTIDEYKNQNTINTKEVQEAIKTATELTKTLTTNQNLKGQFGEDCLEAILQSCNFCENINYIKQFNTTNSEDKKIKPDYLIKLPNNKSLLIDCKLNLEKYLEFKDNPLKKTEFIKDINMTINNLSAKKYESAKDTIQPDFILMYIPLEPVLTTIYTDKDFIGVIKNAIDKNIILVGNSSVLTAIRLTKLLWAQDTQDKNIENIVNIAQNIYELIAQHSQNLHQIKIQMDENSKLFNKEYEKITRENKIFKYTQELRNFGIQASVKKTNRRLDEVKINSDFLN